MTRTERASAKTFSPGTTRLRVYTQKTPIAMSAMNNKKGKAAMRQFLPHRMKERYKMNASDTNVTATYRVLLRMFCQVLNVL